MAANFFHRLKEAKNLLANMKMNALCDEEWNMITPLLWSFSQELLESKGDDKESFKETLWKFDSNAERMKYLYQDPHLYKEIVELTKMLPNVYIEEPKNVRDAHKHVRNADELMITKEYGKAAIEFSEAMRYLSFIDDSTGYFAEMLIKRCVAYYMAGDFVSALADVEDGLKILDEKHNPKMLYIGHKCLEALGRTEDAKGMLEDAQKLIENTIDRHLKEQYEHFRQSHSFLDGASPKKVDHLNPVNIGTFHNAMLPGASDKLEISFLPEKGRVVKAAAEIPAGSIIFSEEAIACWLSPSMYPKYCNYCLTALPRRYLPCRKCAVARYCSSKCEMSAWSSYHKHECDFQDALRYLSFCHLSLRLLIIFGFEAAVQVSKEEPLNIASCTTIGFPVDYKSWHSLFGDRSYLTADQLFMFCCGAMIATRIAEKMRLIQPREIFYDVAGLLLKHMFQTNLNSYSINDLQLREYDDFGIFIEAEDNWKIGIGLYLGSSLVSHSCHCNCTKYSFGANIVMVTDFNIKVGEEITVTYAPYYTKSSVKDRQNFLKEHYLFDCHCYACENEMENVHFAFRCPFCSGVLIWNDDDSNNCLNCNGRLNSLDELWRQVNVANGRIRQGKELVIMKKFKEAKVELTTALEDYARIFYSFTRQQEIVESLCQIAEAKAEYQEAFNCCMKLALIERKCNGPDTMQAVCYLLRCAEYLLLDMNKQGKKAARLVKIRKLFQTTLTRLQQILDRDFKTADQQFLRVPRLLTKLSNALQVPLS